MPDTQTPNYQLWKPEIDAAADYWGQLLNANFDTIDLQLFNRLNKTPGAGQQILPNQLVLTGQPGQGMGDTSAATVGWVESRLAQISAGDRSFTNQRICDYLNWQQPIRSIVMVNWTMHGAQPAGWGICDGRFQDGIQCPDLHDRFIIAAGQAIRGDTGNYPASPSWWFEHVHHSQRIWGGPQPGPNMQAMWDTAPAVDQGGAGGLAQPAINVPYYVLLFLMKTRNIVPADVG